MSVSDPRLPVSAGQPERLVQARFHVPDDWRSEPVDAWLERVLDADPVASTLFAPECDSTLRDGAPGRFIARALTMAIVFMQVSRLAVFQPARVLSLVPEDAAGPDALPQCRVNVLMPVLDDVPRRFVNEVIMQALRECTLAARRPITPVDVEAFAVRVNQALVRPSRGAYSRGKSTLPLLRAAHQAGVPYFHLGGGLFQLGVGSKGRLADRSTVDLDSAIGARVSHDKAATAAMLRLAGLPAPRHGMVDGFDAALKVAGVLGWPLVVKPADRDRGEGVRVDIADESALRTAVASAIELSRARRVIVEQQVPGVCHRLFIVRGRLLYAVARHPMSVTGDGIATVRQLVDAAAAGQALLPDWRRDPVPTLDALAQAELTAAGLKETSIPAAGQRVRLRRIESTEWGGVDEDVSTRVHPENLRVAIAAAALFGLAVAGIDIICTDISEPWTGNGAIINEVNFAPLLGGGEISRAHIPEFLARVLDGDGRIPIELFVGGESAWAEARKRQMELCAKGLRAWAAREGAVFDPQGAVPLDLRGGAFPRARALALRRDVDAILITAPSSEAVAGRWPIEYLDRVVEVDAG